MKRLIAAAGLALVVALVAPSQAQAWVCEKDATGAFFYADTGVSVPDPENEPLRVRLHWSPIQDLPGPEKFVWESAWYPQPVIPAWEYDLGDINQAEESDPNARFYEVPHAGEWFFWWEAHGGTPTFLCSDHEPPDFFQGIEIGGPSASFASSYDGDGGVSFVGASSAPTSEIVRQIWQIRSADGSWSETSDGPIDETFSATVPGPGTYTVEMTATEEWGLDARASCSFTLLGDVFVPCRFDPEPLGTCAQDPIAVPPREQISAFGWKMNAGISHDDGLTLKDVSLRDRVMAQEMGLPYYSYELRGMPEQRAELVKGGGPGAPYSNLVYYQTTQEAGALVVEARWAVSEIPAGTDNCLEIAQRYEFRKRLEGDHCEPSGEVPCGRFFPEVTYTYREPEVENSPDLFEGIRIPQRFHFKVEDEQFNAAALTQDNEVSPVPVIFDVKDPLRREIATQVIAMGSAVANPWDNFHQTWLQRIELPEAVRVGERVEIASPGCPECVHIHWRWSRFTAIFHPLGFHDHNGGEARVPPDSNQDVTVGVVAYPTLRSRRLSEADPVSWRSLANGESLGSSSDPPTEPPPANRKAQEVFWYEGRGRQPADSFFTHGAWFAPDVPPLIYDLRARPTDPKQGSAVLFEYKLTEGATVLLRIERKGDVVGRVSQAGSPGANDFLYDMSGGGRYLRPGVYRAKLRAHDSALNQSRIRSIRFRVRRD
jgi:hypothetical protein